MKTHGYAMWVAAWVITCAICPIAGTQEADMILHSGKIVTVDKEFSIQEAMAVKGERILRVGTNAEVLRTKGGGTKVVDLGGKTVLPGLIDSHVHPVSSALTEFDHPIPDVDSIPKALDYIKSRVEALEDGEWIWVAQIFITRLREQRYPTRAELDRVAPNNPVVYRTGPDASLNSLALELSGIDKDFKVDDGGPGFAEKDPVTGEPTGILRSCTRYIKRELSGKQPTSDDTYRWVRDLFRDYNSVGITSIAEGKTQPEHVELFKRLYDNGELTVRIHMERSVDTIKPINEIKEDIRKIAEEPLRTNGDLMLSVIGIKVVLDGGMLTGSAYMRKPWGVSEIYAIDDPEYRGVLFMPKERLSEIMKSCVEHNLQLTAHSVGDGAVHTFLEVCKEVNETTPVNKIRPCIIHSNFMSKEAIEMLGELGAVAAIQPPWLYLDARTLENQFGYDRLRYFQPLKSIFEAGAVAGGGSDHMQKIGSLRSINPYNPFLGIWTTMTRKAKWYDGQLHPEEALSREQALRFYTINNAYILFQEKNTGTLEEGKLADFIVIDRDILTCPLDDVKDTQVLQTYLGGKLVYEL